MTLNKRLDLIKPKILLPEFKSGRGLGNELNFWIFDYEPEDEMAVRSYVQHLKKSINEENSEVRIVEFDLYKMMIADLTEKKYFEKVIEMEKTKTSDGIISPVKKTLRLTLTDDVIANKISQNNNSETDIIFITGVGKAWPIIRSHTILNNLHSKVENVPIIMFFPGRYENDLKLFGEIMDDNYYRAFKLIER